MLTVIDLPATTKDLVPISNRGPHTDESEVSRAFTPLALGNFVDAEIYLGSFNGDAGWERHLKGDELIQVIDGAAELEVIVDNRRQKLSLSGGMLLVVPQGCWHRFRSKRGVTLLSATPRWDEVHTFVDDPSVDFTG